MNNHISDNTPPKYQADPPCCNMNVDVNQCVFDGFHSHHIEIRIEQRIAELRRTTTPLIGEASDSTEFKGFAF